jgi:hypothetical protein
MKATIFVELVPRFGTYAPNEVWEVRTGRTSTKRKTAIGWGTRYAEVTLDVPAAMFTAPKVAIVVEVPPPITTGEAVAG